LLGEAKYRRKSGYIDDISDGDDEDSDQNEESRKKRSVQLLAFGPGV
jgi:hypothetical protein